MGGEGEGGGFGIQSGKGVCSRRMLKRLRNTSRAQRDGRRRWFAARLRHGWGERIGGKMIGKGGDEGGGRERKKGLRVNRKCS